MRPLALDAEASCAARARPQDQQGGTCNDPGCPDRHHDRSIKPLQKRKQASRKEPGARQPPSKLLLLPISRELLLCQAESPKKLQKSKDFFKFFCLFRPPSSVLQGITFYSFVFCKPLTVSKSGAQILHAISHSAGCTCFSVKYRPWHIFE
jgi:hypothetical protein